jgi:hypothetical protein
MKKWACIATLCLVIWGCNKHKNQWWIEATLVDATTGDAVSGVAVSAEAKVVTPGTFTDVWVEKSSGKSSSDGKVTLEWDRENISDLRLLASKDQYFPAEKILKPENLQPGELYSTTIPVQPKGQLQIRVWITDPSVTLHWQGFANDSRCACTAMGDLVWNGLVDTTFTCTVLGNKYLKYGIQTGSAMVMDSVWCPPFATANLNLYY